MNFQGTLRARLVVLVIAALVPVFGLAMARAWFIAEAAIQRETDNLQFSVSLVAASQNQVVQTAHQMLLAIASAPGLLEGQPAECHRYLKTLTDDLPLFANLGLIGLDGNFRCHGLGRLDIPNAGDRSFFKRALAELGFVADGYFVGRATGKPNVTFAMPVLTPAREPKAVAFAALDLQRLAQMAAAVKVPDGAQLLITDRRGTVLVASAGAAAVVGQPVPGAELQQRVRLMRSGVLEATDPKGEPRIYAYTPSGRLEDSPFFVVLSVDRDRVVTPVRKQLAIELIALALVALLGGALAWFVGGRAIVRPARDILRTAQRLQAGHLEERVADGTSSLPDEFGQMAGGFNLMAQSLQEREQALDRELEKNRKAYAMLTLTVNSMQEGMIAVDISGRLLTINEAAARIFSAADGDNILSSRWATEQGFYIPGTDTRFRPEDLPLARALRGESGGPEYVLIRNERKPDGCLLSCYFSPMRDGDDIVGVLTVFADISHTDRLQREQAEGFSRLRETQRKLIDAQRLARLGIWEYDIKGNSLWVSEEVNELFGVVPGTFEKSVQAYRDFMHPDDRARYLALREQAFAQGAPLEFEYRIVTGTGQTRWIHQFDRLHLDEAGQPQYRIGIVQEITERKRSELLIARSTELLRETGALAKVGGWELNVEDYRVYWSEELLTIFEVPALTELGFREGLEFYAPSARDAIREAVRAAIQYGTPWDLDLPMFTANKRALWVRSQGRAVYEDRKVVRLLGAVQDITQEYASRERMRLLEHSVSRLNDIVLITEAEPLDGPDGPRIVYVNDAFERRTGYTREEVLGKTPRILQGPKTQRDELDRIGAALRKWEPVRAELINYTKSGQEFWLELDIVPLADPSGWFTHWVAVERDITPRKRAEQAAQEHLFMLQRAADAAQVITSHRTLAGAMQEVAEQARGVIGVHKAVVTVPGSDTHSQSINAVSLSEKYAAQYPPGRSVAEGFDAGLADERRPVLLTQAELEAHPRWRALGKQATGLRGWLSVPLFGADGAIRGLLQMTDKYEGDFTLQDQYVAVELAHLAASAIENARLLHEIGQLNVGLEQKVAERTSALSRQEALFRALAEQAPQTVWTSDADGSLTYVNPAWCRIVGGQPADWLGYRWLAVIHPEDRAAIHANWRASAASQSQFLGVRRVLGADGSYHTMSYRASPVVDEQGQIDFWVGIDADISEMKAIETALRVSNQELEAFSYSVSHDLRAPLNTIDGFSRLLGKQVESLNNPKVQHYLSRIQSGASQMGQLIDDLLALAQVNRIDLRPEMVNMTVLAHHLLEGRRVHQPERKVVEHIEDGLEAFGDIRLIRVVLENLLGNAWKFTSQVEEAQIHFGRTLDAAGQAVFFVRDNGAGFDQAYVNKLFKPFQRLHAAVEFPGTGIGLATVSRVIERHAGRVWAEAAPGQGACFYFTLPNTTLVAIT